MSIEQIKSLPYRLQERSVRRFESLLVKAVKGFPTAYLVKGSSLNQNTLAARLRDSIASFKTHKWVGELTALNTNEILNITYVCERKGEVYIAQKGAGLEANLPFAVVVIHIPNERALESLCYLFHLNVLTIPITFDGIGIDSARVSLMQEFYDISITDNKNNTYTII